MGKGIAWLAGLLTLVALWTPPARADAPFTVTDRITDRVGALGGRVPAVRQALDRLTADQGVQLFVVYVRDFSGRTPAEWTEETARRSGMGRRELLMAVATGARQYHVSADEDFPLSDTRMDEVAQAAIEPALRANDWAGAAIGAADGYDDALAGRAVTAPQVTPGPADPGGGSGEGMAWLLPAGIVGVGVAGGGAYLYTRRRRRATAPPAAPQDAEPLPDLDERASLLLVQTDDAVKTSEQEVGFAQAQFGREAAAPFEQAVAFAREQLTAAFRLRQRLDDEIPEDDATRRAMLQEIVQRCTEAGKRLDAESAAFDRLRDLEANAPAVLAEVRDRHARVSAEVGNARELLARLGREMAPSAVAVVSDSPDQARDRLAFADQRLTEAQDALAQGEASRAAVAVRAAEAAVDQAAQLLEGVRRRGEELAQAADGLRAVLDDTERDLATARSLIGTEQRWQDELAPHIARAESVMRQVRADLAAGPVDPIEEYQRVQDAHGELDQALAGVRDERDRRRSAAVQLDQAVLVARSEIAAARDFIATRRGAVGSTARTRLAEAERQLDRAVGLTADDPVAALAAAEQAAALGRQAEQLAEQDVRSYGPGPSGGGGNLSSAVLGGILIESILGGMRGGGGMGGGGGPMPGPGGFGGPATRGRRGAGGHF